MPRVQRNHERRPARLRPTLRASMPARLGLLALSVALAGLSLPIAADPLPGPLELARRINPDAACTRTEPQGLCWCGTTPCGYRIRMFVPVAFVETVRAPGDSLLGLPLPAPADASGTLSSSHSMLDNTAEVHAWLLGDAAWWLSGQPPCLRCQPSAARSPPVPPLVVTDSLCGPTSAVVAALATGAPPAFLSLLPSLAYASEADSINWRTGCRDLLAIDSWATAEVAGLGRWGPLYPRQMRDLGTPPVVHSAKTAYRALSIAREQLGTFPFPVDPSARMQQAYPAVSACFQIGEQPLPQAPFSARPVQSSGDGRYGWFYWRPVSCCVGLHSLAQCAGTTVAPHP